MLLRFNTDYASITEFDPIELPGFTILTGVNGSGKSHLLEAISKGSARLEGIELNQIVLFNYENFRLENEPAFSGQQLAGEKQNAWNYLRQHFTGALQNARKRIAEDVYIAARSEAIDQGKSLWRSGGEQLNPYRDQVRDILTSGNHRSNAHAQGIFSLAKSLQFGLDELEEEEFYQLYRPYVFKNDFLPTQLGKVFWDYYIKYQRNLFAQFQNEKDGLELPFLSAEEFRRRHGQKPWEIANNILGSFDALRFSFDSPEGQDIFSSYQLRLRHTENPDLVIDFDKLSSGERILMALVASIYKASSDGNFPDVLLLDEIDASLHPSMIKNMLGVIQDIFLPAGVSVILVTHSPTTIALAPDDTIYVMNRSGRKRIEKSGQREALSILTEGFATIDEGLKFVDEVARADLTILTEGNNTKLIEKYLELNGVNNVQVLTGIEGKSGANQLRTLYDFFSRIAHEKPILFVFDCDVPFCLEDAPTTFVYRFPRNPDNQLAKKGIENLFDPSLMDAFTTKTEIPDGTVNRAFHKESKRRFEEYILSRGNIGDFDRFTGLLDKINRILGN